MSSTPQHNETTWETYKRSELARLEPILKVHGYVLDHEQPHIGGERFLMQAVTTESGRKLILLGTHVKSGTRVVIKATSDKAGARELVHERTCRAILEKISFAYQTFLSPQELCFLCDNTMTIAITAFIAQDMPFIERPLHEQFTYALSAFKAQESAHATTRGHLKLIRTYFGSMDAPGYLASFDTFWHRITELRPITDQEAHAMQSARALLTQHQEAIERYCGFLTHVDFVPHNIRIHHGAIYLLDHSSLRFGNKYEGWARFLNFMTLYNAPLTEALTRYVRDNRTEEELLVLHLMRLYRLSEINWYYTNTLTRSTGNLRTLNEHRVRLWSYIFTQLVAGNPVEEGVLATYRATRDNLRSHDEQRRQQGLH